MCFVYFKQKAAYDVRISDWSSDVCSSDLFGQWCKEAGCTVTVDRMGNIFARRPGKNNDLPPVVTGSHLDTQPTGGKFDGVYGVLAGLEVIRTLNDYKFETDAPEIGRASCRDRVCQYV